LDELNEVVAVDDLSWGHGEVLARRERCGVSHAEPALAFGSGPWSLQDGKLNDWNGGRGFYYKDHDGHVIELMTMPQ